MGTNFHTAYSSATRFLEADMNPVPASLDKAITYLKNIQVSSAGPIKFNKSSGYLTWAATITIIFADQTGLAKANTIAASNISIATNQYAYVDLSETNNAVLTMAVATITTGSAAAFIPYNRIVLGYRNATAPTEFYPTMFNTVEDIVVITSGASKTIDWALGHKQSIVLGHDVAFTHSNGVNGEYYTLFIRQAPDTLAFTPTWTNNKYSTEVPAVVISATFATENIATFVYRTGIGYCLVSTLSALI